MGLFSSKKTTSTTYAESNNFNLQDVAGQSIIGNSGPVTINTIDAGAIAANQSVSQSSLSAMSDTATSSLMGMATISAAAMEASAASAAAAAAASRYASAATSKTASEAMSANAFLALNANSQMGSLAGAYLDNASQAAMALLGAQQENGRDAMVFAENASARALDFAYEAGRPEAAIMDKTIVAVMVVGGALAAAMMWKKG